MLDASYLSNSYGGAAPLTSNNAKVRTS